MTDQQGKQRFYFNNCSIFFVALLSFTLSSVNAQEEHPGKDVYEKACALCHDKPEATKSPTFDSLTQMTSRTISFALTRGKMQAQGAALSQQERQDVVAYLASEYSGDDWIAEMMCPDERKIVDFSGGATVRGFGFDLKNTRHLTAQQSGLTTEDFSNLELNWAIGFPGVTSIRGQPAVVGDTIFFPVAEYSKVFAFNVAGTPCLQWVYHSDTPLRTSAAFGELSNGRKIITFGDGAATIHTLDASTGELLWKQAVGLYDLSMTTGTPAVYNNVIYASISQIEIMRGARDDYECCKTHGAVIALDGATGKKLWTAHTMPEAKPVRDRGDGQMLWGPSGAPIWSSPAIDTKRGVLYVGTGEATSAPAADTTDAIIAIDLKDGSIRWSFQATEKDIFLAGCARGNRLNCEKDTVYRDVDFGASVILGQREDGSDVVLAGQKSGTVWALDPDNNGKLLWKKEFGTGSPVGGIHWGIAYDGKNVYAPINRPYPTRTPPPGGKEKPGIHAVDAITGKVAWTFVAQADCSDARKERMRDCNNIGLSGAATVVDGAVVAGSVDGYLRVFDRKNGDVLFQFDTLQSFDTLNGITASGGSIDNATIVATNGQLLVGSGYTLFSGTAGNVLMSFRPKQ